jgi:hypothetical protein
LAANVEMQKNFVDQRYRRDWTYFLYFLLQQTHQRARVSTQHIVSTFMILAYIYCSRIAFYLLPHDQITLDVSVLSTAFFLQHCQSSFCSACARSITLSGQVLSARRSKIRCTRRPRRLWGVLDLIDLALRKLSAIRKASNSITIQQRL